MSQASEIPPPVPAGGASAWWLPSPGALAALLVALPAALRPIESFDVLFNLASGRWLLAHGFPGRDPFSFTASGAWAPHEWGYGALLAVLERALGGWAPTWASALLLGLAVLGAWRLLAGGDRKRSLLLVPVFLLVLGTAHWCFRAQRAYLVGLVLLPVALIVLRRGLARGGSRRLWWLLPLTCLWANLHGSWPLLPALAWLAVAGGWLDGERRAARELAALLPVLLAPLAAALAPSGFANLLYPLRFLFRQSGAGIWEWGPLDLAAGYAWCLLGLAVLVLLFTWYHGPRWQWLLPALGAFALATSAGRHAPLAALVLGACCVATWQRQPRRHWHRPAALARALARLQGPWHRWCSGAGLVHLVMLLAILAGFCLAHPVTLAARLDRGWFPVAALQRLCAEEPGRVMNRYFLGGAVSAICGPEFKVFIDGRNDLFPARVHRDYRRLVLLEPGFEQVLRDSRARYLLWSPINGGQPLIDWARAADDWQLLAEEPAGVLFRRRPVALEDREGQ